MYLMLFRKENFLVTSFDIRQVYNFITTHARNELQTENFQVIFLDRSTENLKLKLTWKINFPVVTLAIGVKSTKENFELYFCSFFPTRKKDTFLSRIGKYRKTINHNVCNWWSLIQNNVQHFVFLFSFNN